jgi:uncharacterized protein YjbI with pentapeptide repeats
MPACHALEGAACGVSLWSQRGRRWLSVAVKGQLALVPDGAMRPIAADALLRSDRHHEDSPTLSLRAAGELVPFRPRVDVTALGHAQPHAGVTSSMGARLAIYREGEAKLDKTIHVLGDRAAEGDSARPFSRMPLAYERALRGDENPTGVRQTPNLVHAVDPERPAGFGPISRYAKSRRERLGSASRKAVEGEVAELPDDFDGSYFQAAPDDQQLERLVGDEWIVLDGWSPDRARLSSQLPGVRAEARVHVAGGEREVQLAIDSLHIDADAGTVTLVWRGSVELAGDEQLDDVRVVGGVASGDETLAWPDLGALPEQDVVVEEVAPAFDATRSLQPRAASPATPFEGDPWEVVSNKPIPQQIGNGAVTYADATGSTLTLTPEERAQVKQASGPFAIADPGGEPFDAPPGAPFAGTQGLVAADVTERAPYALAEPGRGEPVEPPEGAPYAEREARPVPKPIGVDTLDLGSSEASVEASRFFHQLPRAAAREAAASPIPERTTETIPVVCSDGLWLVASPWQHRPPRDSLTVIVKATYDIVPGEAVVRREEADLPTGDLHHDDEPARSLRYPSDMAHFKPRADVVLVGHAYPPQGRGVASQVRFRFGDAFDRRVAVFGDRGHDGAVVKVGPTDPEPFERIPLVYERAFGGPGHGENPVGRGMGTVELPNLEDPDDLIRGPASRPATACFAPLAPGWPTRWKSLGTFTTRWLNEGWPYFPHDFDWSHYQCAPKPQQTDHLAGDERFAITGAHAEHTHLEGRLSGERPRCFMVTTPEEAPGADHALEEVKLLLDTAVFDTDAMTVNLVWRGVVEVSGELAPEIATWFLFMEAAGAETSHTEAYVRLVAEVAPAKVVDDAASPANDVREDAELDADLAARQEQVNEALADVAAPLAPERPGRALEPAVRAVAEALLVSGGSFDGVDLADGDLAGLDFSGRSMLGCRLSRADLRGANLAGADLRAADLAGANLTDAVLDGARLDRADLTEAQGERASFRAARGERAQLGKGTWTEARFDGAVLPRLDMTEARFDHAVFDEAVLTRARLFGSSARRASLRRTKLEDALCEGLDLEGAALFEIEGTGSNWERANLADASVLACRFDDTNLMRARLMRADVSATSLVEARMRRVDATAAKLVKCNLMAADLKAAVLRDADFTYANLYSAEVWKADVRGARFDHAIVAMSKLDA